MCGRITGTCILPVKEGLHSGKRDSDEIHQVIACEGCRKGKGADQYDYLEHIDLASMKYLHQDSEEQHAAAKDDKSIVCNPLLHVGIHERHSLNSFKKHEVYNAGYCKTSEDTDLPFQIARIFEREHHSRQPLDRCSYSECYGHGNKDTHYNRQCL